MAYLLGQPAITQPVDRYAIPKQPLCKKVLLPYSNLYFQYLS